MRATADESQRSTESQSGVDQRAARFLRFSSLGHHPQGKPAQAAGRVVAALVDQAETTTTGATGGGEGRDCRRIRSNEQ